MGPGWSLKNDTSNVAECLSAAGGDVQRHEVIFMLLAHVASQIMAMDGRWLSLSLFLLGPFSRFLFPSLF